MAVRLQVREAEVVIAVHEMRPRRTRKESLEIDARQSAPQQTALVGCRARWQPTTSGGGAACGAQHVTPVVAAAQQSAPLPTVAHRALETIGQLHLDRGRKVVEIERWGHPLVPVQ